MKNFILSLIIPFSIFGQEFLTYNHNGQQRAYIYYEPSNIEEDAPLVFVAHGYSGSAQEIMNYCGMNDLADQYGFSVCYPEGTSDNWGLNFWNVGYEFTQDSNVDDIDYITQLASFLQTTKNLSVENTFLTGMSNGAELCYLIACEYPGLFKAYAPVAGTIFPNGLTNNSCSGLPVSIFELHGTNDNVTLFEGDSNDQFWGPYLGIDSIINYWTDLNELEYLNIDTLPNFNNNNKFVISYKYFSKQNDKKVWLYKHKSGHSWDVDDIVVAEEIWGFFSQFLSNNNSSMTFINNKKFLIKKIDLLGREAINKGFQLFIYDDGSVEKKYFLE
ncbi:MAG: esterase [Flavobacteriales bacterium]|nr:esterase [Flavobacteriales bacterium]|tara:strand:- start:6180 stop:7169 length:990 start_codon:yes stop_codon:yes gene_type:complete